MRYKLPLFHQLIFTCFLLIVLVGCKNDSSENHNAITKNNEMDVNEQPDGNQKVYTIEFKKKTNNLSESEKLKNVPSDVTQMYYVDNFELNNFFPKDKSKDDTIKFVNPNDKVLVGLTFHQIDFFSYLIHQGDSIVVQYRNGFPYVTPNNSNYPRFEYSYDSLRRARFNIHGVEADEFYEHKSKKSINEFLALKQKNHESELIFLDSLYSNKLLSQEYYNLLKEKSRYKFLNLYTSYYVVDKTNPVNYSFNREDLNKSNLLNTNFYYKFLIQYVYNVLNKNEGFRSSNGFTYNTPLAFDRLLKDTLITNEKVKNSVLKKTLYDIHSNFPNDTFQKYLEKFKNNVKDTLIVSEVKRKLLTEYENLKDVKNKVFVLNKKGDVSSLKDIIDNSKQSLVYIDFWASWCMPCLKAMPAASALRKKYKNKDILFIYISIDQDKDKWLKALDKEELPIDNSYLALNYPEAAFFKDQNLRTIPRYMLIKNKKIIYSNALGPDSEELVQIIDKNIKK